MAENEVIETRNARIWLGDDGIVRDVQKPSAEETLGDAKEGLDAIVKVSKGKKRPLLVDMVAQKSVTKEAHEYYSGDDVVSNVRAVALLVGSPVSKVIGSFFLRLRTTNYPIKLFTSEVEAVEWLKGFLK